MPKGDGSYEQTVVVNNSAVAGVIGKGGLTIKNIITVSGARVQISQKDPANPSRRIARCRSRASSTRWRRRTRW